MKEHDNSGWAEDRQTGSGRPRVAFVSEACHFDAHNESVLASRSLVECLSGWGFPAVAVTGYAFEAGKELDPGDWSAERGLLAEFLGGQADSTRKFVPRTNASPHDRRTAGGVQVMLYGSPATHPDVFERTGVFGFLGVLEGVLDWFQPDVLVSFGAGSLTEEIRRSAQARGIAVVVALHGFNYRSRDFLQDLDAVIAPSQFAASYYRRILDLTCSVLPCPMPIDRSRARSREPRYATFVNPSCEKGVFAFARIADELGRRRLDIPLLVVEGGGTERTLVDCGLDLRAHGNVSLMAHTPDNRIFWGVTRICVMPSLRWESQPLVAIEAMINCVPVVGSDRGAIPEALVDSGIVLGLPSRLGPATRELPTAEEVEAWVKAIIALWDDQEWYSELSRRAIAESSRWSPEVLEPKYVDLFERLRQSHRSAVGRSPGPGTDSMSPGTRTRKPHSDSPEM